jgi:hypothetical protein
MSKFYFSETSETPMTKKYWVDEMKSLGLDGMKLYEAKRLRVEGYFYCHAVEAVGEDGNCGPSCENYSPRNKKSGCCINRRSFYERGKEVVLGGKKKAVESTKPKTIRRDDLVRPEFGKEYKVGSGLYMFKGGGSCEECCFAKKCMVFSPSVRPYQASMIRIECAPGGMFVKFSSGDNVDGIVGKQQVGENELRFWTVFEPEVGVFYSHKGSRLRCVVAKNDCEGCFFFGDYDKCKLLKCKAKNRWDKRGVVLIKVGGKK